MRLALLAVAVIAIAGTLLWMSRRPVTAHADPAPAPAPTIARPSLPVPTLPPATPEAAPVEALAKALSAQKLEVASDAFRNQLDEVIPGRLYGEAARCYKGGGNRDEKIKLEFRLAIADGHVTIPNLRVLNTTLTDKTLERCIIDEIRRARWQDDKMPDYESTEEMMIRLRGFKSHQNQEEDQ